MGVTTRRPSAPVTCEGCESTWSISGEVGASGAKIRCPSCHSPLVLFPTDDVAMAIDAEPQTADPAVTLRPFERVISLEGMQMLPAGTVPPVLRTAGPPRAADGPSGATRSDSVRLSVTPPPPRRVGGFATAPSAYTAPPRPPSARNIPPVMDRIVPPASLPLVRETTAPPAHTRVHHTLSDALTQPHPVPRRPRAVTEPSAPSRATAGGLSRLERATPAPYPAASYGQPWQGWSAAPADPRMMGWQASNWSAMGGQPAAAPPVHAAVTATSPATIVLDRGAVFAVVGLLLAVGVIGALMGVMGARMGAPAPPAAYAVPVQPGALQQLQARPVSESAFSVEAAR